MSFGQRRSTARLAAFGGEWPEANAGLGRIARLRRVRRRSGLCPPRFGSMVAFGDRALKGLWFGGMVALGDRALKGL
jgi:hypothetical protein